MDNRKKLKLKFQNLEEMMGHAPSSPGDPASTSSTSTAVTSSASKQLTYTTAGTVYDPAASQPLQPPVRRGRSHKMASGGSAYSSGPLLLPKSVIATFPIFDASMESGSRVTGIQYTPLQQNYDRAVSPENSPPDESTIDMASGTPQGPLTDAPPDLAGLFPDKDLRKFDNDGFDYGGDTDTSDDFDDFVEDPLAKMPVKSLQNLASYPNPNQKRAQKVLRRGAKPGPKGVPFAPLAPRAAAGRSTHTFVVPDLQEEPISPPGQRMGRQATPAAAHDLEYRSSFDYHRGMANRSGAAMTGIGNISNGRATAAKSYGFEGSSSIALASGPGAPRPLTAGPPGQRQYRASTFESTFKALQPKEQVIDTSSDNDGLVITRHMLEKAGIKNLNRLADNMSPFKIVGSENLTTRFNGSAFGDGAVDAVAPTANVPEAPQSQSEKTFSWTQKLTYNKEKLLSTLTAQSDPVPIQPVPIRPLLPSLLGVEYEPGTDRMTAATVKSRVDKTNRDWYAGADFMAKSPEGIYQDLQKGHLKTYGAIGDGRPTKKGQQYRPMSIDEANKMTTEEHARPLINMAVAKMKHHHDVEEAQFRGPRVWPHE